MVALTVSIIPYCSSHGLHAGSHVVKERSVDTARRCLEHRIKLGDDRIKHHAENGVLLPFVEFRGARRRKTGITCCYCGTVGVTLAPDKAKAAVAGHLPDGGSCRTCASTPFRAAGGVLLFVSEEAKLVKRLTEKLGGASE